MNSKERVRSVAEQIWEPRLVVRCLTEFRYTVQRMIEKNLFIVFIDYLYDRFGYLKTDIYGRIAVGTHGLAFDVCDNPGKHRKGIRPVDWRTAHIFESICLADTWHSWALSGRGRLFHSLRFPNSSQFLRQLSATYAIQWLRAQFSVISWINGTTGRSSGPLGASRTGGVVVWEEFKHRRTHHCCERTSRLLEWIFVKFSTK